jgi:hypothetical protein
MREFGDGEYSMIAQIVRYKSRLSHEDVGRRFDERADRYRQMPRLVDKYYVHFPDADGHEGIYIWDSPESLNAWRATNLAESPETTYAVVAPPSVELGEVMHVLQRGS